MNKLQKVEYEILCEFIKVCEKLNLQYYLVCGSALGAVKYQGFIPWDDDVDVALPRKDYLIFVEKAQKILPEYYFVQNYKTDANYHHFGSKIRDSRTTYIESDQKELNMNHGVFIDVIPLDPLPKDKKFSFRYRCFRVCQLIFLQSPERYKNVIKYILKPFVDIRMVYSAFEKYLYRYLEGESSSYCNFHNAKNYQLYTEKSIYGKGERMTFEGMSVIVPKKFDEYLTSYYGNWREELPKEQQVGHHYCEILDLNRPYTDYIEKISRKGKRIQLNKSRY